MSSTIELTEKFNPYGDQKKFIAHGHGADIASQRADDLDMSALAITNGRTFSIDLACGAGGQALRMAKQGAKVLALDIVDMSNIIGEQNSAPGLVNFVQFDLRYLIDLHTEFWANALQTSPKIKLNILMG